MSLASVLLPQQPQTETTVTLLTSPWVAHAEAQAVERYLTLTQHTHPAKVLVLCSNRSQQQRLLNQLYTHSPCPLNEVAIFTLAGLVRYWLTKHWPTVEATLLASLPKAQHHTRIEPQLVGLEPTETLLGGLLHHAQQADPTLFISLGQSTKATLNQLIRRSRFRAEHRLSRQAMADWDARLALSEAPACHKLEAQLESLLYQLRWLDAPRQLEAFFGLLGKPESPLTHAITHAYTHALVLEGDEHTTATWHLLEALRPHLHTLWLHADPHGGAKRGYANASIGRWQAFLGNDDPHPVGAIHESPDDTLLTLADHWQAQWQALAHHQPTTPPPAKLMKALGKQGMAPVVAAPAPAYTAMVTQVMLALDDALAQGAQAGDFCWILPDTNAVTLTPWLEGLAQRGLKAQWLAGVQRASRDPLCQWVIALWQWACVPRWGKALHASQVALVLRHALQWHETASQPALVALSPWVDEVANVLADQHQQGVWATGGSQASELTLHQVAEAACPPWQAVLDALADKPPPYARTSYEALRQFLRECATMTATEALWRCLELYAKPATTLSPTLTLEPLHQVVNSAVQTLELAEAMRWPEANVMRVWLTQSQLGVVADTPTAPLQLDPEAVVIGTPQKLLDLAVHRPVVWWLDASSNQWHRTDEAPLYNSAPWGLAASPTLEQATHPDVAHQAAMLRAGAVVRKLVLTTLSHPHPVGAIHESPAKLRWRLFCSHLDAEHRPNDGLLLNALAVGDVAHQFGQVGNALSSPQSPHPALPLRPLRDDQQPVLAYTHGTMAITAVPGAGKTFVTVELILHLINQGCPPEGIVVLTYMESAAKTLLARLKPRLEAVGMTSLPQVMTIHALAYRLLKQHAGWLLNDTTIADEAALAPHLQLVAQQVPPWGKAPMAVVENWPKHLASILPRMKELGLTPDDCKRQPQPWATYGEAMAHYQHLLAQHNQLDYNDLLLKALATLQSHPDWLAQLRQGIRFVIEDEAQDSSQLMQQLLALLAGQNGDEAGEASLIRVGDTNQSITTTFSTADTQVFRQFITQAQRKVSMTQSGRCAEPIITLANAWLTVASAPASPLSDAFWPTAMQPVAGFNPSLLAPLQTHTYESDLHERQAIVEAARAWLAEYPAHQLAVLTRNNREAGLVANALAEAGLPVWCATNAPTADQQAVLNYALAWLLTWQSPHNAKARVGLLKVLRQHGCYGLHHLPLASFETLCTQASASMLLRWHTDDLLNATDGAEAVDWPLLKAHWHEGLALSHTPAVADSLAQLGEKAFAHEILARSNALLVALYARRFYQGLLHEISDPATANPSASSTEATPLDRLIDQLRRAQRTASGGLQWLTEAHLAAHDTATQEAGAGGGLIQVMSLHKAKGQEFDWVWLAGLTQRNYPLKPSQVTLRADDDSLIGLERLAEQVRQAGGQPTCSAEAAKQAYQLRVAQEEARLLYVGVTRAKRALQMSYPQSTTWLTAKGAGKPNKQKPCIFWQWAEAWLATGCPTVGL
jgi:superfamily I DNA/RNA helicase